LVAQFRDYFDLRVPLFTRNEIAKVVILKATLNNGQWQIHCTLISFLQDFKKQSNKKSALWCEM
jgi:hypothetical protein